MVVKRFGFFSEGEKIVQIYDYSELWNLEYKLVIEWRMEYNF